MAKLTNSNWVKHKNSSCDNPKAQITINLKLWPNLKTHIVAKLKYSNCEKKSKHANWDINQFVSKLKISNCDKAQKLKWLHNSNYDKSPFMSWKHLGLLVGKTGHLDEQWYVLWAAFFDLTIFFRCHSNLLTTIQTIESLSWFYSHGVANSTVCVVLQKVSWYLNNRKGNIFFLQKSKFLPLARVLNLEIVYCYLFLRTLNLSVCADNSSDTIKFNLLTLLAVWVMFWIIFHLWTLLSNLLTFLPLFGIFCALWLFRNFFGIFSLSLFALFSTFKTNKKRNKKMFYMLHVIRWHMSYVTCHLSHITYTYHLSPAICH